MEVIAVAIFVIGFMFIFQGIMNAIIDDKIDMGEFQQLQSKFFIRIVMLESVPLMIIILHLFHRNNM